MHVLDNIAREDNPEAAVQWITGVFQLLTRHIGMAWHCSRLVLLKNNVHKAMPMDRTDVYSRRNKDRQYVDVAPSQSPALRATSRGRTI